MALTKRLYKDHEVVITAKNLNDIQDAILALEQMAGIVPGERETTKIIDVVNPSGTLTAAQAATLPNGLYWVANPVTFLSADQAFTFQLAGLATKTDYTWLNHSTGQEGTTDENGILTSWRSIGLPLVTEEDDGKVLSVQAGQWAAVPADSIFPRIAEVTIYEASDSYSLELTDGSTINGTATFDENGFPTDLADDAGNSVAFAVGNPVGATDSAGNTVTIILGGE